MKNISDLEQLLTMSSNEIEMLDKDVLERFLSIISSEQKTSSSSGNEIDLNNNNDDLKMSPGFAKLETDEDIDNCKANLIQSLKQQLEQYRQIKH
ncbi:hypothetical protein BLA29_014378 [Euroglyphus maynei]|uniref:Uncharacterized protein n=1 Tax=Euroglyphus maynei TaxID=6958 RepID=A0A1Y3BD38_EURMA|nr:hypothetical protein BLA29_014378 [Euroglyphus maynei]